MLIKISKLIIYMGELKKFVFRWFNVFVLIFIIASQLGAIIAGIDSYNKCEKGEKIPESNKGFSIYSLILTLIVLIVVLIMAIYNGLNGTKFSMTFYKPNSFI
jgi:hypothetical protein